MVKKIKKAQNGTKSNLKDSTKSNLKGVSRDQMFADMNAAAKKSTPAKVRAEQKRVDSVSAANRPAWKKNAEEMGYREVKMKKGGKVKAAKPVMKMKKK